MRGRRRGRRSEEGQRKNKGRNRGYRNEEGGGRMEAEIYEA